MRAMNGGVVQIKLIVELDVSKCGSLGYCCKDKGLENIGEAVE